MEFAAAFSQVSRPRAGMTWTGRPHVQKMLRTLADPATPVTHETLNGMSPWRSVAYLRDLLMLHGVLPAVDRNLTLFGRWLDETLAGISRHGHRQVVGRFASWHVQWAHEQTHDQEGDNTRARGTPPTRRDNRAAGHRPHQEIKPSRAPQASRSRARKIEVGSALTDKVIFVSEIARPSSSMMSVTAGQGSLAVHRTQGVRQIDPTVLITMLLQFGLQQLDKYIGVSRTDVPDMSGPDALGSELRANFRLHPSLKASLVMVGLQRGNEWNVCVPVKYGESLRLRVQRGIYQATAWFFASAPGPVAALMLIATAETEIVIASGRAEKFTLTGQEPARAYLAQIRDAVPMGPPFMLPDDVTRMLPAAGRNRELPQGPVLEEAPLLEMVCAPCCRHVEESGERCSGWPAEGETYCARHSGHSPGQAASGMEIVSWVASRAPEVSDSTSDPRSIRSPQKDNYVED